jgi:hypothetical protein
MEKSEASVNWAPKIYIKRYIDNFMYMAFVMDLPPSRWV